MKKTIIALAAIITFASCENNRAERIGKNGEIIMIGNKPYKMVYIVVDRNDVTTIVPADSSVSVIPFVTTRKYSNGKTTTTQTTIKVD